MKLRNWLILATVVLLTVLPLWLAAPPAIGPDGIPGERFGGADNQAQTAIGEIAPGYRPWFSPLLEPASGEIASLLFALQAALGAGFIGYWLGASVTRERLRREMNEKPAGQESAPPASAPSGESTAHAD